VTDPVATVFLSYAHADKPLARALKVGLDAQGCRVWIDEGELKIGERLYDSIAAALDQVDFVAALMSPTSIDSNWCQKEISLAMTGEVSKHGVTVLPLRIGDVAVPATLKGKKYLDVDPDDIPAAVDEIMSSIRRYLDPPAPLPPRRRRAAALRTGPSRTVQGPHGPLHIVGVDREGITKPLGDGNRGSALYAVPLELSATPDPIWARLFVQNWDHPSSFSTMHRPGIARVAGNHIVLDGEVVPVLVELEVAVPRLMPASR